MSMFFPFRILMLLKTKKNKISNVRDFLGIEINKGEINELRQFARTC